MMTWDLFHEECRQVSSASVVCKDGLILTHKLVLASLSTLLKNLICDIPVGDQVGISFSGQGGIIPFPVAGHCLSERLLKRFCDPIFIREPTSKRKPTGGIVRFVGDPIIQKDY